MNPRPPRNNAAESYRESCDNCAKSKVRCGKEQPWCQRCIRRGQACSYSPSQRTRKRTYYAANSEAEERTAALSLANNETTALLTPGDGGLGSYTDIVGLLTRGSSAELLTPENTNSLWISEGAKDLEKADAFIFPDDSGIGTSSLGDLDGSGTATFDFTAPRLPGLSTNQQQHCEAELISTLAKLDHPSLSCRGGVKSAQNLGAILTASRLALSCTSNTVSCTCTPNASVALLVTATFFRLLSWYEIVLHNCRTPGEDTNSSGPGSSGSGAVSDGAGSSVASPREDDADGESLHERPNTSSRGAADDSSLFVPPMTIGPYELDAENRDRMIGHIVLSELGKMGQLLDGFSQKFCGPHSVTMGNDSRSQLHLALEIFVRNKHSVTVLAAQDMLKEK